MEGRPQVEVTIRPLMSQEDQDTVVRLQGEVWGYNELEVDSRSMLTVAARFAGQVLGGFVADGGGERMVGFSLAFASLPFGHLHSHRVGVVREFQSAGVGRRLKLAQREDALARGVGEIQWTFDPMQGRNAWFNLQRLGGVVRQYLPNLYGITTSPLHGGLPTDRLLVEWALGSERVKQALEGAPVRGEDVCEVELPDGPVTRDGQARVREQMQRRFAEGYTAVGFRRDGDRQRYVLERL